MLTNITGLNSGTLVLLPSRPQQDICVRQNKFRDMWPCTELSFSPDMSEISDMSSCLDFTVAKNKLPQWGLTS